MDLRELQIFFAASPKSKVQRGWKVFSEKAKCTNCLDGKLLTNQQFDNVGIGMEVAIPGLGRNTQTKDDKDRGAFKTPTLLDIGKSRPYFRNGSVPTLEEAVDVMIGGGKSNQRLDTKILKPAKLNKGKNDRADLLVCRKY